MSFNLNKEKLKSLKCFAKLLTNIIPKNIICDAMDKMKLILDKTYFKLPIDLYSNICGFLNFNEILYLTNANKYFYKTYYKHIWTIYNVRQYNVKTALYDYNDIIQYYSLEKFYSSVFYNRNNHIITDIEKYEAQIYKLQEENSKLGKNGHNYTIHKNTNNKEIISIKCEIQLLLDKFGDNSPTKQFLINNKFNSVTPDFYLLKHVITHKFDRLVL